jgi:pyruvate dehydrogenase E2 component (dihydrolipoamide acetyltransferase)
MLTKIVMPSGGQTTNESKIVKWHKKTGDAVKKGDVLFEIETDKAVMEIESYAEGTLLGIKFHEGEYAATGEIVAYIGDMGEKLPADFEAPVPAEGNEYQPIVNEVAAVKAGAQEPEQAVQTPEQAAKIPEPAAQEPEPAKVYDASRTLASPAARFLARQENIDINEVGKSLPDRIIKRADVEGFIRGGVQEPEEEYYFVSMSPMRKTIARRMTESVLVAPHFTVSMEVDMTRAIELRQELNAYLKDRGIKVSYNDLIMKCAAKAVGRYPVINSTYQEDGIKVYKHVNFGLAVSLENGLVVPVVKYVDRKSIAEIAKENSENIEKARGGKLQDSQMTGGTITLSNLGMFGVDSFTAIINQPESCILAVGSIIEKPVVLNGSIVARPIMSITASFDHRVIDGATGAAFLREVKVLLEKPELLLV